MIDRERRRDVERAMDRRRATLGELQAFVGEVVDGGSFEAGPDRYFLLQPMLVGGEEEEGEAATLTGYGDPTPVVVLGEEPEVGDLLVARFASYRWVASRQGGSPGGGDDVCSFKLTHDGLGESTFDCVNIQDTTSVSVHLLATVGDLWLYTTSSAVSGDPIDTSCGAGKIKVYIAAATEPTAPGAFVDCLPVVGQFCLDLAWLDAPGAEDVCLDDFIRRTFKVCVTDSCNGEPVAGVAVNAEGCNEPDDGSEPMCFAASGTTGEDGCVELALPLRWWKFVRFPNSTTITVAPYTPPGYSDPVYGGKTTVANVAPDGTYPIEVDPSSEFTCCDMAFRKGPSNPSGLPYWPRGKVLLFVTSGSGVDPDTGEVETWEIEVDCDGEACAHSDDLPIVGGPPTVETCPPGDYSDAPWDHWEPPALASGRVPCLVRIWYDGTDWHGTVKVLYSVARPPAQPDGCNADPSQQNTDFYGWLRSDATCDDSADPKLTVPPDPELVHKVGGTLYAGETTELTAASTSYTVGTNNPVEVTLHFPPLTIPVHGGNISVKLIDSITFWQPVT